MANILIIEDEQAIRRVLRNILSEESKDFNVDDAENGKMGLDKMAQQSYDLVLCDIKMPGMDGIEVLDRIAAEYPDTAIVKASSFSTCDLQDPHYKIVAKKIVVQPGRKIIEIQSEPYRCLTLSTHDCKGPRGFTEQYAVKVLLGGKDRIGLALIDRKLCHESVYLRNVFGPRRCNINSHLLSTSCHARLCLGISRYTPL